MGKEITELIVQVFEVFFYENSGTFNFMEDDFQKLRFKKIYPANKNYLSSNLI